MKLFCRILKNLFRNGQATSGRLLKMLFLSFFVLAFARVHLRVQTTMVGYDIGRLKTREGRLLEERSELKMELARLTTKNSLMSVAGDDGVASIPETGTLASQ